MKKIKAASEIEKAINNLYKKIEDAKKDGLNIHVFVQAPAITDDDFIAEYSVLKDGKLLCSKKVRGF